MVLLSFNLGGPLNERVSRSVPKRTPHHSPGLTPAVCGTRGFLGFLTDVVDACACWECVRYGVRVRFAWLVPTRLRVRWN